jgi:hypothetical protein
MIDWMLDGWYGGSGRVVVSGQQAAGGGGVKS